MTFQIFVSSNEVKSWEQLKGDASWANVVDQENLRGQHEKVTCR